MAGRVARITGFPIIVPQKEAVQDERVLLPLPRGVASADLCGRSHAHFEAGPVEHIRAADRPDAVFMPDQLGQRGERVGGALFSGRHDDEFRRASAFKRTEQIALEPPFARRQPVEPETAGFEPAFQLRRQRPVRENPDRRAGSPAGRNPERRAETHGEPFRQVGREPGEFLQGKRIVNVQNHSLRQRKVLLAVNRPARKRIDCAETVEPGSGDGKGKCRQHGTDHQLLHRSLPPEHVEAALVVTAVRMFADMNLADMPVKVEDIRIIDVAHVNRLGMVPVLPDIPVAPVGSQILPGAVRHADLEPTD